MFLQAAVKTVIIGLLFIVLQHVPAQAKVTRYNYNWQHPNGAPAFQCRPGWELRGTLCYYLIEAEVSWHRAEELCKSYGADLAKVESVNDDEYIWSLVKKAGLLKTWIGLQLFDENTGLWSDGTAFDPGSRTIHVWNWVIASWDDRCLAMEVTYGFDTPHFWILPCLTTMPSAVCSMPAIMEGQERCDNGHVVPVDYLCDGDDDCGDLSDERDCGCVEAYYGISGTVQSMSPYVASTDCLYVIEGPAGTFIHLSLLTLQTEEGVDVVQILAGAATFADSVLMSEISGEMKGAREFHSFNHLLMIRFYTDADTQMAGFSGEWAALTSLPGCGGTRIATPSPRVLTAPSSPLLYPPKQDCRWHIESERDSSPITLQIELARLGKQDYLEIYDGLDIDATVLANLSASESETMVTRISSGRFVLVRFHTGDHWMDGQGTMTPFGFTVSYFTGCEVRLDGEQGVISSPGYPGHYAEMATCSWVIQPGSDQLSLLLHDLDLETDFDFLEIYTGNSSLPQSLLEGQGLTGSWTSDLAKESFETSSGWLKLVFTSDSAIVSQGFNASYSVACPPLSLANSLTTVTEGSAADRYYRSQLAVMCKEGAEFNSELFISESELTLECLYGGNWNVFTSPHCQLKYCGLPGSIAHGNLESSSGPMVGDTATYSCDPGFVLTSGSGQIECLSSGQWQALPVCRGSQCSEASVAHADYSVVLGDGQSHGSILEFSCEEGWRIEGVSVVQCGNDSVWIPQLPSCTKLKCSVPHIPHGSVVGDLETVTFGEVIQVTCDPGHDLDTSQTATCLSDQTFSIIPACLDKDECSEVNGGCHHQCVDMFGTRVCRCRPGYRPNQKDSTQCQDIDECQDNNAGCSHSCNNEDGSYYCSCPYGFVLYTKDGVNDLSLTTGTDWHLDNPQLLIDHTCVPAQCIQKVPRSLPVPLSRGGPYYAGDAVRYLCTYPHILQGQSDVQCGVDGQWTPSTPPVCVVPTCPGLQIPDSVVYPPILPHQDPVNFGHTFNFTCAVGRAEPIIRQRICLYNIDTHNFELTGDPLECPVTNCSVLPQLPGATYVGLTDTIYNSQFTVQCGKGDVLLGVGPLGDATVVCDQYGLWDFGTLACIKETCSDPGRPPDGEQIASNYELGSLVHFRCERDGYALSDPWPLQCDYVADSLQWNASAPTCLDVEPPVFKDCPDVAVTVPIHSSLSDLPSFRAPTATDNTAVVQLDTEPAHFSPTQVITEDMTVTYTAVDEAGGRADCVLNISAYVNKVPTVTCPNTYTVYIREFESVSMIMEMEEAAKVNVTDDHNKFTVTYDPEVVQVNPSLWHKSIVVTVKAVDDKNQEAVCHFSITVKPPLCSTASLPTPENGHMKCFSTANGGWYCSAECNPSYYFSEEGSYDYQCGQGEEWKPNTNVPNCAANIQDAEYPLSFTVRYSVSESSPTSSFLESCPLTYTTLLEDNFAVMEETFSFTCTQLDQEKNVSLTTTTLSFDGNSVVVKIDGKMTPSGETLSFYEECAQSIQSLLDLTLSPDGLYPIVLKPLVVLDPTTGELAGCPWLAGQVGALTGDLKCPEGTRKVQADIESVCVSCAAGSVLKDSTCELCPLGTYQNQETGAECKACPAGTYTLNQGSSTIDHCLDQCPAGFVSKMGSRLPPCDACAVDTYSDDDKCVSCPETKGTVGDAHDGITDCLVPCPGGYYSATSYLPCTACPPGFYTSQMFSTGCQECADNITTVNSGSVSEGDCVKDPCGTTVCQFGECVRANHLGICVCQPGYHGDSCDVTVKACESFPCYYGNQCLDTGPNEYSCNCINGTSGDRCEFELNDCSKHDCKNGAACQDLYMGFHCLCPSEGQFFGEKCNSSKDVCQEQPCLNNAVCIPVHGEERLCRCGHGFTGHSCETPIDVCEVNPCFHGGTCRPAHDGYTCTCAGAYHGDRCQERDDACDGVVCAAGGTCIDDYRNGTVYCLCPRGYDAMDGNCSLHDYCQPNPCLHGSCSPVLAGFECRCDPDYMGPRCAHNIDDCQPNPCHNGGSCTDDIGSFLCDCTEQYHGATCLSEVNECTTLKPCDPTGTETCQDRLYGYQCICRDGYAGRNCSEEIDECLSEPCYHGGTCRDLIGGYECTCSAGWTGGQCRDLVETCTAGTCEGKATCVDLFQDYYCSCSRGTHGRQCQHDNELCENANPCLNGGTCQQTADGPMCVCPPEFTGAGCQLKVDPCTHPEIFCYNGATCQSLWEDYKCLCPPGYTGDHCESLTAEVTCPADCPAATQCLQLPGSYSCYCPLGYTGPECDKALDTDFDLFFTTSDSHAVLKTPVILTGVSLPLVRLYIRFLQDGGEGTFLKMNGIGVTENATTNQLMSADEKGVYVHTAVGEVVHYPYFPLTQINDRLWHYVVILGNAEYQIEVYVDSLLQVTASLPENMAFSHYEMGDFVLGADFVGYLSQVYMFNRTLNFEEDISKPARSRAYVNREGLLVDWGSYTIQTGVRRIAPGHFKNPFLDIEDVVPNGMQFRLINSADDFYSVLSIPGHVIRDQYRQDLSNVISADDCIKLCADTMDYVCRSLAYSSSFSLCRLSDCQRDSCLQDWQADLIYDYYELSYIRADDKPEAPQVTFCPEDQVMDSDKRVNFITWDEPTFKPDDGSLTVYANYESGSVFTWGEHIVSYVAEDRTGQSANCNFRLAVKDWSCSEDSLPGPGADLTLDCQTVDSTRVCQVECRNPTQHMCLPGPSVYSCGPRGAWNPREPYATGLLSCTDAVTSLRRDVQLTIVYPLTVQTLASLDALDQRITLAFVEWDTEYTSLCAESQCIDLQVNFDRVPDINVTAHITLTTTVNVLVSQSGYQISPEDFLTRKLFDEEGFDFTKPKPNQVTINEADPDLSTSEVTVLDHCPPAHMLSQDGITCVECCAGSFYDNQTQLCQPCPIGQYQSSSGQLTCLPCPTGGGTAATGSRTLAECFTEICQPGHYYNMTVADCEECPVGFYQTESNAFLCEPCPATQTTSEPATVNRTDCYDTCDSGQELAPNQSCVLCSQGTYRTQGYQDNCEPCPPGLTTLGLAAVSKDQCKYEACMPGSYLDRTLYSCHLCPQNTYQPEPLKESCIDCPLKTGTESTGTTELKHCQIICQPGYHEEFGACIECPYGHYKEKEGIQPCEECPSGKFTAVVGATSRYQCDILDCKPGMFYSYQSLTCEKCPRGSYRDEDKDILDCLQCPLELTTPTIGATSAADCNVGNCTSGMYTDPTDPLECELCPLGAYQDEWWQDSCKPCPDDHYTHGTGAGSLQQCISHNECDTDQHNCHPDAVCVDKTGVGFTCVCRMGFEGDGFQCTSLCDLGHCLNGATCIITVEGAYCQCRKHYQGSQCDYRASSYDDDMTPIKFVSVGLGVAFLLLGSCILGVYCRRRPKSSQGTLITGLGSSSVPTIMKPAYSIVLPSSNEGFQPYSRTLPTYPRFESGIRQPSLFSVKAPAESRTARTAYMFYEDVGDSMDIIDDDQDDNTTGGQVGQSSFIRPDLPSR